MYQSETRTTNSNLVRPCQALPAVNPKFKFWKALENNGAEVEFTAYDMSWHGPSDLINSMDHWQWAIELD